MVAFSALGPRVRFGSLSLCLALCLACEKKAPEPSAQPASPLLPPSSVAAVPVAPSPAASAPQEPLHVTWIDPPTFRRVPPSNPMRKASYVVPRAEGDAEDGELTVFYFGPGQGGSIDANVDRWVGQFGSVKPGDVKRADREANGLRQHTVELESGTFSAGAGMGMAGGAKAKENYGLVGGIVESPSGAYFFKMTGPSKTVKQAKPEFYKLLDSVKTAA
ncbi:MAG: hypothetical protein EOO73_16825 [Myxococcales bacterium]|nr:MAG: hypothetical protein EOO73_16825 [Myxococcales bacterium]